MVDGLVYYVGNNLEWYKTKAAQHYTHYQEALDNDDEKTASIHMKEYLNYTEMIKRNEDA